MIPILDYNVKISISRNLEEETLVVKVQDDDGPDETPACLVAEFQKVADAYAEALLCPECATNRIQREQAADERQETNR